MATTLAPTLVRWVFYPLLALVSSVVVCAVFGLVKHMVFQYSSPLGDLKSPPVPSFFWGHLQMLHNAESTNLFIHWKEQLGSVFTYKGFIGGYRLVIMDPRAILHVLSRHHEYPKPSFVRDTLASMAGDHGLLVVEGETHKRQENLQRKILNPSFTSTQVNALLPIFYQKAAELRDIWLALVDAAPFSSSPAEEDLLPVLSYQRSPHETLVTPATPTLPLIPPTLATRSWITQIRHRGWKTPTRSDSDDTPECCLETSVQPRDSPESPEPLVTAQYSPVRVDVLNWLGRATLDAIGIAGFGHSFNALVDDRDELAIAFAEMFSTARKFRFILVLQAWFPVLRYLNGTRKPNKSLDTTRRIGMELVRAAHSRLEYSNEALFDLDFRTESTDERTELMDEKKTYIPKGRDLLSLLIKSNIAISERQRMSQEEILSQISTFMAAGHETTSSAMTWSLYALAIHPECQEKLREELAGLPSTPAPETLNSLPYLDSVVRESLRLYSPVSQTMRVASLDDTIPVSVPYLDASGRQRNEIRINEGDVINIPLQAMNKSKLLFGEDADQFVPERWQRPLDSNILPTLYSGILTFLLGGRACIGYRFAVLEIKAFLFVLIRTLRFETRPDLVIEKRVNVVTRPWVKSEPERGNQMPLLLSRAPRSVT